jgi:hypothetical protein
MCAIWNQGHRARGLDRPSKKPPSDLETVAKTYVSCVLRTDRWERDRVGMKGKATRRSTLEIDSSHARSIVPEVHRSVEGSARTSARRSLETYPKTEYKSKKEGLLPRRTGGFRGGRHREESQRGVPGRQHRKNPDPYTRERSRTSERLSEIGCTLRLLTRWTGEARRRRSDRSTSL